MRKAIVVLLLSFITFSFGQSYKKNRKVVPVLTNQDFYLNGGTKGAFGGKSRINLLISLPKNTVEWYYVFSTSPNQGNNQSINLVAQLTRLVDNTGMTAIATSALLAPTSNGGACDVYLMDRINSDKFMEKVDSWGGTYSYFPEGTRENFHKGTIQIKGITSGNWYLGFKNPSVSTGVNVSVEVAAIVEEEILDYSTWSTETKARFYDDFYKNLKDKNVDDEIAKEIAGCLIDKVATLKTPELWDNMNEGSKQSFLNDIYATCTEKYQTKRTPEQEKAATFGSLGWKAYENGELEKAIEYSKKALEKDNSLGWVQANLGLFCLINHDGIKASDYYIDSIINIKNDKINAKKLFKEVINDINSALIKYPTLVGYREILQQLQQEYDRL